MIEVKATVVDRAPGIIWVKTNQGCIGCQGGCGLADVGRFLTRHHATIALACHETVPSHGKEVTIALSEPALLRAGLFVYFVPAVFIVLGAALADFLTGGSDSVAIAGALGGLILGIIFMHLVNHHPLRPSAPQLVQTFSTSGDLDNERSNG